MSQAFAGWALLALSPVVSTLAVWHYSGYRKGGRYDPAAPEALIRWHASEARKGMTS